MENQAPSQFGGVAIPAGYKVELQAVITRADGTVHQLGTLASSAFSRRQRLLNDLRLRLLRRRSTAPLAAIVARFI